MIITFISSEDSACTVHTKSNNIEIMMNNETDADGLYRWAMQQKLLVNGFKWKKYI